MSAHDGDTRGVRPVACGTSRRDAMGVSSVFRWTMVAFFATHIPATILVDSQAVVPAQHVPDFAKALLKFHVETNHDALMAAPPVWLRSVIWLEVTCQLPFFFAALHALVHRAWAAQQGRRGAPPPRRRSPAHTAPPAAPSRRAHAGKEWIRLPGIAYGASTATTLLPILGEILAGTHYPTEAAKWTLFFIYFPYLVLPLWMMFALAANDTLWDAAPAASRSRKRRAD